MKKIITILSVILSLSFSFAFASTNTTNFHSQGTTNISAGDFGLSFVANTNTTVTAVTKKTTTLVSTARILNASLTELGTASFVGDVATFSSPIAITSGATYYVLINNGANIFVTDWGNVSGDLPSVNADITFPSSNNAVFSTPYSPVVTALTYGGGNQLGITGIITDGEGGGTTTPPPSGSDPRILFLGDSLTEGLAVAQPYPFLIQKPSNFTMYNLGVSSRTTAMIEADADTMNATYLGANKTDDIIVVWAGSADLYQAVGTSDAVTTFNHLKAFCLKEKALGAKVVVLTMLPRPNNTVVFSKTEYLAYNALIRAHWQEFATFGVRQPLTYQDHQVYWSALRKPIQQKIVTWIMWMGI